MCSRDHNTSQPHNYKYATKTKSRLWYTIEPRCYSNASGSDGILALGGSPNYLTQHNNNSPTTATSPSARIRVSSNTQRAAHCKRKQGRIQNLPRVNKPPQNHYLYQYINIQKRRSLSSHQGSCKKTIKNALSMAST